MDRVGLFSEMGYITIGDKYKTPMQGKNIIISIYFEYLIYLTFSVDYDIDK